MGRWWRRRPAEEPAAAVDDGVEFDVWVDDGEVDTRRSVVLFDDTEAMIWAQRTDDGGLTVYGQDLGPRVKVFGDHVTEYEYGHVFSRRELGKLLAALGELPGTDPLEAAERHRTILTGSLDAWLEDHDITASFWNHLSF